MLMILSVIYCSLAFGIHGGQFITGINRQARNVLCAAPFAVFSYLAWDYQFAALFFTLAFLGANMGFDHHPLWLKGFITLPPFGAALLPLAYYIGDKTPLKNVVSEYLSGSFYGLTLCLLSLVVSH